MYIVTWLIGYEHYNDNSVEVVIYENEKEAKDKFEEWKKDILEAYKDMPYTMQESDDEFILESGNAIDILRIREIELGETQLYFFE